MLQSSSLVKRRHDFKNSRHGAILPIVAVFVVILLAMAAFSIDMAYVELVKTQLRAATDSAAKAGACAIVQGANATTVKNAAIAMAAANHVAGRSLAVTNGDITLGQSILQPDGSWQFVAGLTPYQAIQVTSRMSSSNANGNVALFFGPFMGSGTYSPTNVSVASAFACEVCLVLDRSHSMCWDTSGTAFRYPSPILSNITLGVNSSPTAGSRWQGLSTAVNSFCSILSSTTTPPRVAVVTWASDVGTSSYEYSLTGQTSVGVVTDVNLTTSMSTVNSAVAARSTNVMLGATNMGSGIDQGISILTGPTVRPYARKIMILMTDGQWNAGNDPVLSAYAAQNANITIHCVCFLQNADQTTTQQIASITGGKFYYAADTAGLTAAFQDLAHSLPIVLTK